ncbi:hypothetical protein [Geoalkalibacter halelectricus]|uniref:Type II secretion system protein GspE N-terminal domain-containing protein n=1 Tax=Geoalkalibacter halelectricus TaxID=2847045 RepID=A0ABY5ZLD6_9BACT|nr:hypothetical protein [Geoalkalibacter halelectricus]MDO3379452.1 hypothetical protein [Geoalkalibacter halelectricus]UWZ79511.1 hypothetical protein L9S41_17785 [Geoalkalibacter halelectricus]
MLREKTMKLGDMLKAAGLIDDSQLKSALSYQRNCGVRLGAALVSLNYISETQLLDFLAEQLKYTRVDLGRRRLSEDVVKILPESQARRHNVIAVARKEHAGVVYLLVAMSDPTNRELLKELESLSGCRVRPALDTEDSIRKAIDIYYSALSSEDESSLAEALDQILLAGEGAGALEENSPASRQSAENDRLRRLIELLVKKKVLSTEEGRRLL